MSRAAVLTNGPKPLVIYPTMIHVGTGEPHTHEANLVSCPHCGFEFDPLRSLSKDQILGLPEITGLPSFTLDFLKLCPLSFLLGVYPMGTTKLAVETGYTTGGIYRQIRNLQRRHLVEAVQKTENGSYCLYRFCLPTEAIRLCKQS